MFESLNERPVPKQDKVESTPPSEKLPKSYWKRHLGMMVLSAILAYAPEKAEAGPSTETERVDVLEGEQDVLKQRREAFEKMKALVDGENLDEKLAELKEMFGPAIEDFLQTHRIQRDMDSLKNVKDVNDPETFLKKAGPQFLTPGSLVANAYNDRWEKQEFEDRKINFVNIDSVPEFSEEKLQEFLKNVYPEKYLESSVSTIEFVSKNDIRAGGQVLGTVESKSLYREPTADPRIPIKISLPEEGITANEFVTILVHEIGHAMSWNNSPIRNSADRISMLYDVSSRVNLPDRYMSSYVENITLDSIDIYFESSNIPKDLKTRQQSLHIIKSNEYWAEIHKAYFDNKVEFQKNHPVDYELVKKWVQ